MKEEIAELKSHVEELVRIQRLFLEQIKNLEQRIETLEKK